MPDGWLPCEACDGKGVVGGCGRPDCDRLHTMTLCDHCANGVVPAPHVVEAAADSLWAAGGYFGSPKPVFFTDVRAALVAAKRAETSE